MKKSNNIRAGSLTLPILDGNGGLTAGINPGSNSAFLDAMDELMETNYLLAHPANAMHLRKSIRQYKKGELDTVVTRL
jgi:hypothetical protein